MLALDRVQTHIYIYIYEYIYITNASLRSCTDSYIYIYESVHDLRLALVIISKG